jgi:signal transduction histidine kinase
VARHESTLPPQRHLRRVPQAGPPDRRVVAALAVLSGEDVADVAERLEMPLSLVLRHTETFRAAGVAALTGVSAPDELAADRYLGMVAHEMRAPLAAAAGWVELLGTDGLADDEQEPARRLVLERLGRVRRLCDDLLDATALRLGRLRLNRVSVDLADIVARVVRAFGDDRVTLLADQPAQLHGDPCRLDQVVTNLVANALRHGAPGPVEVAVRADDLAVELRVTNAGPLRAGVCAERIFDAYERGCGAGHGLGLYVTREIVLAHGGRIDVRGSDEVTEFVCRLPIGGQAPGALDVPAVR